MGRPRFRPLTLIVNGRETVDAVLHSGSPEWVIGKCAASSSAMVQIDPMDRIMLRKPARVKEERGYGGVDYSGKILSFKSKGKEYYLRTMVGPAWFWMITYEGVSEEAAAEFDSAIDSMCLPRDK